VIHYIQGDATLPISSGILLHVCNDIGLWGAGFVVALSKRYPETQLKYLECYRKGYAVLGMCIPQVINDDLTIIHMIAQKGVRSKSNPIPLQYDKLETCLHKINSKFPEATIHMPRIGCGLGGGDWNKVEPLIVNRLDSNNDREVFIYDL